MGLFSSKKKKIVGTSVTRVIEDEDMPSNSKESVISAIMRGDSVADTILEDRVNGRVPQFEQAFAFAKSGQYVFGLPDEEISESASSRIEVNNTLNTLQGTPVTLNYYRHLPLNFLHWAWEHLYNTEGYTPFTNEVVQKSQEKGYPVYVKNIVVELTGVAEDYPEMSVTNWDTHPQDRYTPSRGNTPTDPKTPVILYGQTTNRVLYELEWETEGTTTGETTPYSPPPLTDPIVLASGYTVPALSEPVVLQSETTTGGGTTEPGGIQTETLTVALPAWDIETTYHQVRFTEDASTNQGYWSYEQGSGTYPAIDSAGDSTIVLETNYMPFMFFISNGQQLGAPGMETTDKFRSMDRMLSYMFMDFREISDNMAENPDIDDVRQGAMIFGIPFDTEDSDELLYLYRHLRHLYDTTTPVTEVTTGDAQYSIGFTDSDFRIDLDYAGITLETKTGTLSDVGAVTRAMGTYSYDEEVTKQTSPGETTTETVTRTHDTLILRYQETANSYKELTIYNPSMVYFVEGSRAVYVNLNDEEGRLLLPMCKPIIDTFSYNQKERLYLRSLHFVFNSLVVVKVKWYQTGIFKAFLTVVAVVITVLSAGSAIPVIAGFLGISTLAAVVVFVIITIAMSFTFRLVIKELGLENSLIAAVVLIALAAYTGVSGSEFFGFIDASVLLMVGNGLAQGVGKYSSELISEYNNKYEQFEELLDERNKELEASKELLGGGIDIDPFEFIGLQPLFVPGEAPDLFYQRTIHSGNIGTLAFDYLHGYFDVNLQLPTPADTLGDNYYGV